jgi:hypothetical protein
LPVQASAAHVGLLQFPPAQLKTQSAPSLQSALGHTEPPPVQVKLQTAPSSQVTARLRQLPELLQSKSQVMPSLQVAVPLHCEPPPSHLKSHSAPGWQSTSLHLPDVLQSKAHTAPGLQVVPLQLLPPPEQFSVHVESLSQTTLVQ